MRQVRSAIATAATGTPAAARCAFASPTRNGPKWKIEAASTAVAWPSRMPATRWSSVPTPPEAMTGTRTASATARVSSISKPDLVPSRSIEVSSRSRRRRNRHEAAGPFDRVEPGLGLRPPWVKTAPFAGCHRSVSRRSRTTMHWLPNFSAASRDEVRAGRRQAVLIETLSGAGCSSSCADIVDRAHPAADRQRHEALLGGAAHHVVDRVAVLVAGGDVEEAQFVGALAVVDPRLLDGIAGIGQVDEVDALDDATVLDVETGDDAHLQHQAAPNPRRDASAAAGSMPPVSRARGRRSRRRCRLARAP